MVDYIISRRARGLGSLVTCIWYFFHSELYPAQGSFILPEGTYWFSEYLKDYLATTVETS